MKANKLISLDTELIERLRSEDNASGIVNELVRKYYSQDLTEQELKEDKQKTTMEIEKLQTRLERIDKELEEYSKDSIKGFVVRRT